MRRYGAILLLAHLPVGAFDKPFLGVTAPVAVYKPGPSYTEEARAARLEGEVWLSDATHEKGIPGEITVRRSLGMGLDEKAIETARKWRFKPGLRAGVPAASQVTIAISFHLLDR